MTEWDELADWWEEEVAADPAYADDVQPVVDALTAALSGPTLDLGCGNGRLAPSLPGPAFGCDSSLRLLRSARASGLAVVRSRLPDLAWARDASVGVAVACLVLEHLPDAGSFFAAVHRVVRSGGALVVVSNHPAFTATGAGPVADAADGEVLWRWGTYCIESISAEPAGSGSMVFHHRSMAAVLNAAGAAGWKLERMIEAGASRRTIARIPALAGQEHMPRLVGWRWRR